MSTEANERVMRRWIETIWVEKDLSQLEQYLDPEVINHNVPPELQQGIDNFRQTLQFLLTALPDAKLTIDDLFAVEDKVVWRGTFSGTPDRPFLGVAPNGKSFTVQQIHIFRLTGSKIVEHWLSWNQLEVYRQMGVLHP